MHYNSILKLSADSLDDHERKLGILDQSQLPIDGAGLKNILSSYSVRICSLFNLDEDWFQILIIDYWYLQTLFDSINNINLKDFERSTESIMADSNQEILMKEQVKSELKTIFQRKENILQACTLSVVSLDLQWISFYI